MSSDRDERFYRSSPKSIVPNSSSSLEIPRWLQFFLVGAVCGLMLVLCFMVGSDWAETHTVTVNALTTIIVAVIAGFFGVLTSYITGDKQE